MGSFMTKDILTTIGICVALAFFIFAGVEYITEPRDNSSVNGANPVLIDMRGPATKDAYLPRTRLVWTVESKRCYMSTRLPGMEDKLAAVDLPDEWCSGIMADLTEPKE